MPQIRFIKIIQFNKSCFTKSSIKRIERDLIDCYRRYGEINRLLANECTQIDFDDLVKYENLINVDEGIIYIETISKNNKYEGRLAESGEGVGTKSSGGN